MENTVQIVTVKNYWVDINETATDYPGNRTIHELFADQVRKTLS